MGKLYHAISWGIEAYRYQRDKPHGKKASRRVALMIALQGAHLIAGQRWRYLNPSYWLLLVGQWKIRRNK